MRTGGCACGAVRFIVRGAPVRAGLCHCMTCRKAHGSAFNPFVVYRREQVAMTGNIRYWQNSARYQRAFCPVCGSRIMASFDDTDEIELSLGSFDDPGVIAPHYESGVIRREPWLPALPVRQNDRDPPEEGDHG